MMNMERETHITQFATKYASPWSSPVTLQVYATRYAKEAITKGACVYCSHFFWRAFAAGFVPSRIVPV